MNISDSEVTKTTFTRLLYCKRISVKDITKLKEMLLGSLNTTTAFVALLAKKNKKHTHTELKKFRKF